MRRKPRRARGGASVPCPTCGLGSSVVYTRRVRLPGGGAAVYRLRVCESGHKFSTEEQPKEEAQRVQDRQGNHR